MLPLLRAPGKLPQGLDLPQCWAVIVYRIDPEDDENSVTKTAFFKLSWSGDKVFMFPGIIFARTIADVLFLATRNHDVEGPQRHVRNILRAITDPLYNEYADDPKDMKKNSRFLMMMDNEDLESWLEL